MTTDRFLLDFVETLRLRYEAMLANLPKTRQTAVKLSALTPSLAFAKAALEKQALIAENPDLPLQIAVVGPTQAGKSSLVNLILGTEAAGVSPLAGFTVHPQAFLCGFSETGWLDSFFHGFKRFQTENLPKDRYDCFGIAFITTPLLPPCVVWDTPDFDSLRARVYFEGVLRTVALADLLVLVVSKDKYADRAVWDFLALIEPLAPPTLVCINKVRPASRETLTQSWQEKWQKLKAYPCPRLITLEYYEHQAELLKAKSPLLTALRPLLKRAYAERSFLRQRVRALLRHHWPEWSAPIRAELEAQRRFKTLIDTALARAVAIYRADFLDHPIAYATFQRALVELLTLLEIPGLARPMIAIRRAITWPVKALLGKRQKPKGAVAELVVLRRGVEHALLQLLVSVRDQAHDQETTAYWWQAIDQNLRAVLPSLIQFFEAESLSYYQAFEPQVEAAALSLYRRLQEMPATLNSLRAARGFADAAGLALLFHTGGVGPHDLVLAPAMLSLTSLLAESALGKYMEKVATELKRAQLEAVKAKLSHLSEEIAKIARETKGLNLPETLLTQVETLLNGRSSYGLKLVSNRA